MVFILTVLGVVLILEGIPYFGFPGRVKQWAITLQDIPERTLRVMGLISVVAGLAMLYLIRFL
ncbi:MAG: DUF2065 domain-containing protein [Deltaproteobacteria bacterium]|nr:DUF2065 domain-containing protein [Deltaproteobacteria bacterium]MBI5903679.1 DUF2065 domain-containing protein [Deltaproteobacteria bacterium]